MSFSKSDGTSSITGDFSKINKLVENLDAKMFVDIGILGENNVTEEGGITLAGIAAVHEFGSTEQSIPARSWLRMPLETGSADIEKTVAPTIPGSLATGDIEGIFKTIGVACEARIQEGFESGGFGEWQPLKDATIKRKGSAAILIDTGAMRQAVTSKVGSLK